MECRGLLFGYICKVDTEAMEYPPVKPHNLALQELEKSFIYEEYAQSFDQLLELAGDDIFAELEIYYHYYGAYGRMGKVEEAAKILHKARAISQIGNEQQRALGLLVEALYERERNNTVSVKLVEDAILLLKEKEGRVYCLALECRQNNLRYTEDFEGGIRNGRELIEKASDPLTYARAVGRLGGIYRMLKIYDEAETYYKRTLDLYQQINSLTDIAGTYHNLSTVAFNQYYDKQTADGGYLLKAMELGHTALEAINKTSDLYFKSTILNGLALLYNFQGKQDEAVCFAEESVAIAKQAQLRTNIAHASYTLGYILGTCGRYDDALQHLESCIPYLDIMSEGHRIYLYEALCDTCNKLTLYEKGFLHSQKLYQLISDYDAGERAGVVYHNKILLEQTRQQEHQIHELKLKSVEEKVQLQATQLVSQTEQLAKFRDELREIARQYPSSDPGWRAVKEKLKELPCKQIDWEKFEAEFNAVHPEFTNKLYERYPTLTPMEVKMCSLLRLNLKSQEIARLFCVTERAVEFHRLNIRKKCGIPKEQSLSVFLNSL